VCCPTVLNGQCCDATVTGSQIVDNVCCTNANVITISGTPHCCANCNTPQVACSSATPAITPTTYTWMSGSFCCANTYLNGGTCCPSCVRNNGASPVTVATDLRRSGDCGYNVRNCCPSNLLVTSNAINYCCPVDPITGFFSAGSYTGTPYSSGNWAVVALDENGNGPRCCPDSNIKCDGGAHGQPTSGPTTPVCCNDQTDVCTSSSANGRCCPASQAVLYNNGNGNTLGCCLSSISGTSPAYTCNGSPTQLMTNCLYIAEGNCCPTTAVTRDPSNVPTCCIGTTGGPTWYWTPANSASGTPQQACCPASRTVLAGSPAAPVACCPLATTNYEAQPILNLNGNPNYCCPLGRAGTNVLNGNRYCCPSGGLTVVANTAGALTCCPANRVPVDPITNQQLLDKGCCPDAPYGGQPAVYWINGACCPNGAFPDSAGVWHCCRDVTSPQWVNNACCPAQRVLTSNNNPLYCCPNSIPANSVLCTSFPPPTTTPPCYVYNGANNQWIVQLPNGATNTNCCPADRISYNNLPGSPAASASTTYICCPTATFTFTTSNPCCPPGNVPTTWDGVQRWSAPQTGYPNGRQLIAPGSKFCCPFTVAATTYTNTFRAESGLSADCCPLINVNLDPRTSPNTAVTSSSSTCCATPGSFLVDQVATGASSNYLYCCPSRNLLPSAGNYYCCANAANPGDIWFTSTPASGPVSSGCCPAAAVISNPANTQEKVCCPNANPVWTDTAPNNVWPSGVAHCCDARFALPTTVPALASTYCCPTLTPGAPPAGIPGSPANPTGPTWQVFRRVPTNPTTGSQWNSVGYQCCDPANKQVNTILDGASQPVNICCPSPNLVYIIGDATHQPTCCPNDTIRYDGAQGDLTKASCCPTGSPQTGVSQTTGRQTCCPDSKYNGVDTCCDATTAPNNPVPTLNTPCCNASARLDISPAPWNRTGQYLCCPPVAGKPAPFVNPDPTFNPPVCCYGYATSQPPKACCVNPTDFATTDDPCCDTTTRPGGTCCPAVQWIPGANGAPQTGTCCPDTDIIITNTTGTSCCPRQYADVTGTVCCVPTNGVVLDDTGNCCPLDVINTDPITGERFCCGPSQRDDFGVCCTSAQTIHSGAVINGVANATVRICCLNNTVDCAGICYWNDPLNNANVLVPLNTQDANGRCCPAAARDCAGLCPINGVPINSFNATFGDCCPPDARDCLGKCYGRDKNCCENPATLNDCGKCTTQTGCGWCSSPFSSSGQCLSGNHFGPYTDPSGVSPCDAGNRWVINPPSEVISKSGTFADGWQMEYKNYTVTLSPNQPLQVNFTVRVPANVPLDLYILQDGTASFGLQFNGQPSSLQNFQAVLPNLLQVIQSNVTSDLLVGFGLFADKPVEPLGFWSASTLDYLWRNLAPLSANTATVVTAVNALQNSDLQGGSDIPEGTLEALLAIGVQVPTVGWRQPTASFSSNHVVLVVTDAPPHKASLNDTFNPNGPFDIQYWINSAAPDTYLGSSNYVRSSPAWVPNDLLATFQPGQCTRPGAATVSPPYPRAGICQDYPSFAETISKLQPQKIAPVFIVAPTNGFQPNNVPYPTDIAFSEWTNFVNQYAAAEGVPAGQYGLVANLTGVGTSNGASALQDAILRALYAITQTIALRVTSGSEWVTAVSPSQYDSAVPGQDYTFTVTLFWNGTWPGFEGPHGVDVLSLFPKTNFPIEPGHIDIYLAKEQFCGYCGDGIVQPEINEQCEPGVVATADIPCCNAFCEFEANLCNGLARCSPVICDITDGKCKDEPVTCTPIIDPIQSLCSSNSCINGLCVVSCFGANESNPCCDDGDNCTRDTCISGVCRHDFELPCDCGGNPAYNSCFACIAVSNTTCGWDLATGTCTNVNITDLLLNPQNYGIDPANNISVVVYEQDVADKRCVAERSPGSKVGIIVGVIAGAAALAAFIALAAVFGGRFKEIAQRIFGSTNASGGAANKVQNNPAYEVAIEQQNPLHS